MLLEANLSQKGIYLSPKNLLDKDSSFIFIPKKPNLPYPKLGDINNEKILSPNPNHIFLSPPGLALSKLLEQKLGYSFLKTDLETLKRQLPKLFEDLEIAESFDIQANNDIITVTITDSIFNNICHETKKFSLTHEIIGCLLTSAIACILAKSTGKSITIVKEQSSQDGIIVTIDYKTLE